MTRTRLRARLEAAGLPFRELAGEAGWAIVVPALAGRLLGAGVDEENVCWVAPGLGAGWNAGGWNAGGQRTWLAPEGGPRGLFYDDDPAAWTVPPALDPGGWREAPAGGGTALRAAVELSDAAGKRFRLELERAVSLSPAAGRLAVRVEQRLVNAGQRRLEREIGLWSILQVPAERPGLLLAAAGGRGAAEDLPDWRPYFGPLPDGWARPRPGLLALRAQGGRRWKVGLPPRGAQGVLLLLRPSRLDGGWLLVGKRFPLDPRGCYLDAPPGLHDGPGDALQLYNHFEGGPLGFAELEGHAPAVILEPAEGQSFAVELAVAKGSRERVRRLAEELLEREVPPEWLASL